MFGIELYIRNGLVHTGVPARPIGQEELTVTTQRFIREQDCHFSLAVQPADST